MLNKSLNIQKEIKNDNGTAVGFLTSQISVGYGAINFSFQVIDKVYIESNPEIIKLEYESFMKEIKGEAISNGWLALKDEDPINTEEIIN